jgi:undecaprenyl-diphosphatase
VALVSQFLVGESNPIDIALFLHLGTFFAVIVYFINDWKLVLSLRNRELLRFLIIATIVSLAVGFPLYIVIRNVATGAILLLIMGLGLLVTAYFQGSRKFDLGLGRSWDRLALVAGLLQGLAVIPGLSRSGATIFGLSLGKSSPSQILKMSYMMSAPVVLFSSAYLLLNNPTLVQGWPSLISSFLVGILSLSFLMKIAERMNFRVFALIFAALCFIGGTIMFLS